MSLDRRLRVAFVGMSGPFAPAALHQLLKVPQPFEVVLVVQGHRLPIGRVPHRLHAARAVADVPRRMATLPPSDSLMGVAQAAGMAVLQTCDIHAEEALRVIRAAHCDVMVCVGYHHLFAPCLLQCFDLCLNLHPSRLPSLRGPAPLFWAVRRGMPSTHVSLHMMDSQEDHGPIVAQQALLIPPRIGGESLYRAAAHLAAMLVQSTLGRLSLTMAAGGLGLARGLIVIKQDDGLADRAPRPKPEDVAVHPPSWGVEHLLNFACAAPYFRSPWLQAGDDDGKLFIRRGLRAERQRRLPGQYVLHHDTLAVQCKDGVAFLQVQT